METPTTVPEKGFYYHYKHDPSGPVNNYAYEVVNIGVHTEAHEDENDANMVVYRPLYENAFVYKAGRYFDLRPLDMWMGTVEKDGRVIPRFARITDPAIIAELESIKNRLYSD